MKVDVVYKENIKNINYDDKNIKLEDIEKSGVLLVVPNFKGILYEYAAMDEDYFPEGCFGENVDVEEIDYEQVLEYIANHSEDDYEFKWAELENEIDRMAEEHEVAAGGRISIVTNDENHTEIGYIIVDVHENFEGKEETLYAMDATSQTQCRIAEAILKNKDIYERMDDNNDEPTVCIDNCYYKFTKDKSLSDIVAKIPEAIRLGCETQYYENTQGIFVEVGRWKNAFKENGYEDIGGGVSRLDFDVEEKVQYKTK